MSGIQLVAHGPPARAALLEAVRSAKGEDPLAPVTVSVPSTYAGLSLRRALAGADGLVNVRFLALARLAELLGAPALAEQRRRPLTRPLRAEAVRAVLTAAGGPFASVAGHPATERALEASFLDLRRGGDGALDQVAGAGEPAASVARLYREFRMRTAAFYDDEDLAVAAAAALAGAPPALRELGDVVLFLPTRLSPAQTELVRALGRAGRLHVLLGLTGDAVADEAAEELAAHLGELGELDHTPIPAMTMGTSILSAPDPEDEIRAVIRDVIARAAAGTPLHRMAILYRVDEPYARLAHELLDGAGIPWSGPSTRRLAETTAGRVLLGVLLLAEHDFARDAVVEWIASGPVRDPVDGGAVPASRWDILSREAGIVTGLAQWSDRLTRLARRLTAELDAARDDELSEAARRHREADLEHAERLARFVAYLGARLTPASPGTWPSLAAWARELLDLYLGGEGRRATWPETEVDAARRVTDALDGLAALAEIRAEASLPTFVRALESELDVPAGRVGRFGTGVFAGRVHDAYGGDFDVVHVVGMAEGAFPPLGREDPLIPDRVRRLTGGALPIHAVRRVEERRDYVAALAAAPVRSLSYPRADPRAQRKRLPARWLLETASHLLGEPVGAEELTRLASSGWLHVVPSFEAGVRARDEPGSLTERDVRSLRVWQEARRPLDQHPLIAATPSLAAGVAAVRERRSAALTRFDGHVGPVSGLLPDDALSPTALEDWATCPFRYLLGRVLRVRDVERPEATDRISALERGSLEHAVLAEFLDSTEPRTSPDQPWDDDERALLLAIAERHCNEAEAEGLTGRPLLWKLDRRRILRELEGFLDTDEVIRARLGIVPQPGGRELAFGFGGETGDPAAITLADGRAVRFHGRIDRVDHAPGGSPVVVFDYKTGRTMDDPAAGLERGNLLQLPVYALAMAGDDPSVDVRAYYWYVRLSGTDALAGFDLDDATRTRFADRVSTIVDGIGAGVFPAFPDKPRQDGRGRDTWENCCYCPFDRVCAPARDDDWTRKRVDPAVVRFRDLADPPPDVADAGDEQ